MTPETPAPPDTPTVQTDPWANVQPLGLQFSSLMTVYSGSVYDVDEVNAARAEVERQRAAHLESLENAHQENVRLLIDQHTAQLAAKDAEVEQLRAQVQQQADEVERLKAAATMEHANSQANRESLASQYRGMLDTLRAEGVPVLIPSDSLPPYWQVASDVVKRLRLAQAEAARLREALELIDRGDHLRLGWSADIAHAALASTTDAGAP